MENAQTEEYSKQGKELREHGTVAFPAACYSGDWTNLSVPLHWHTELEAGFVTEGQITLTVGKERMLINAGEGFFVNSGIPHAFSRGERETSRQCSLVFDPSIVGGRIDSIFWQRYVQPVISGASMPWFHLKRNQPVVDTLIKTWTRCSREEPGYELLVREGLTGLMVYLEQNRPPEQPVQMRRIRRDKDRIHMMMDYIQLHYSEELTTAGIAASAMISVSEALRCFHNTIGMTPIQCLKHYRIQQAAAKLRQTDQKISQIAADCGFQEMSYFAKAFRETMGITPSQYRKEMDGQ